MFTVTVRYIPFMYIGNKPAIQRLKNCTLIFLTPLSDNNVYFNAWLPYMSIGNVPALIDKEDLPLCPLNYHTLGTL